MLIDRDINEIVQLLVDNESISLSIYSQFNTIPEVIVTKKPEQMGVIWSIRNRPDYILVHPHIRAELEKIKPDYHGFMILYKGPSLPSGQSTYCSHTWVDVGFHFSKWVCKHCNIDRER